jgi:AcrR family transcriptional regulator
MQRDKQATKQKLIDAVGTIVRSKGFGGVGVNAVAREAGVDKVLIYRYFDSLDGLLEEYVFQRDFFAHLDDMNKHSVPPGDIGEFLDMSEQMFIAQLRHAFNNPEFREILLWELNESNEITNSLAETREAKGLNMLENARNMVDFDKFDIPAAGNIIIGGIYYMVLRSRNVDQYSGIDLSGEEGRRRLENAISLIIKALKNYISVSK